MPARCDLCDLHELVESGQEDPCPIEVQAAVITEELFKSSIGDGSKVVVFRNLAADGVFARIKDPGVFKGMVGVQGSLYTSKTGNFGTCRDKKKDPPRLIQNGTLAQLFEAKGVAYLTNASDKPETKQPETKQPKTKQPKTKQLEHATPTRNSTETGRKKASPSTASSGTTMEESQPNTLSPTDVSNQNDTLSEARENDILANAAAFPPQQWLAEHLSATRPLAFPDVPVSQKLFFVRKGLATQGTHWDSYLNMFVNCRGISTWRIASPNFARWLMPCGHDKPGDNECFTQFFDSSAFLCEKRPFCEFVPFSEICLNAGDAIYVPPMFFHAVQSVGDSEEKISCAVSFFFDANPSNESLEAALQYQGNFKKVIDRHKNRCIWQDDTSTKRGVARAFARMLRHVLENPISSRQVRNRLTLEKMEEEEKTMISAEEWMKSPASASDSDRPLSPQTDVIYQSLQTPPLDTRESDVLSSPAPEFQIILCRDIDEICLPRTELDDRSFLEQPLDAKDPDDHSRSSPEPLMRLSGDSGVALLPASNLGDQSLLTPLLVTRESDILSSPAPESQNILFRGDDRLPASETDNYKSAKRWWPFGDLVCPKRRRY